MKLWKGNFKGNMWKYLNLKGKFESGILNWKENLKYKFEREVETEHYNGKVEREHFKGR